MISTVNTLTSTTTAASDLAPLVKQLAKRADLNKDGQVSTTEFSQFLTGLLESITTAGSGTTKRDPPAPDGLKPATPAIEPAIPGTKLVDRPKT